VTSHLRTAELARRTLARVEQLGGPPVAIGLGELIGRLVIDGRELGPGYGRSTPQCAAAMRVLRGPGCPRLDAVYSGKAAAALLRLHHAGTGPLVFWASKSSMTLTRPSADHSIARWPPRSLRLAATRIPRSAGPPPDWGLGLLRSPWGPPRCTTPPADRGARLAARQPRPLRDRPPSYCCQRG
jgi:hypothetical protein